MAFEVGYRYSGGFVVGLWDHSGPTAPTITVTPTLQEGEQTVITGLRFSTSGNRVFANDEELTVLSESPTEITLAALDCTRLPLSQPVDFYVMDADGAESAHLSLTIVPPDGWIAFTVTSVFTGDPSTRLSGIPDIEVGDEIIIRNVSGTNVTASDVSINPTGSASVRFDADNDPSVDSFEYNIFDGDARGDSFAEVTWPDVATATTTVPDVLGMTEAQATTAAENANMVLAVVGTIGSVIYDIGDVAVQFPPDGTVVLEGSTLEVTLSTGPTPVACPELRGLDVTAATAALQAVGLDIGTVRVFIDGDNSGLVLNQSVEQGIVVNPGTTVDVVISSDQVPDVVGLTLLQALDVLTNANLIVLNVTDEAAYSGTYPTGYVVTQDPAADSSASPDDTIDLELAIGLQVAAGSTPNTGAMLGFGPLGFGTVLAQNEPSEPPPPDPENAWGGTFLGWGDSWG